MDDFMLKLAKKLQATQENLSELNRWESAVVEFMKVSSNYKDIDFQKYSPYIIRTATKYILIGFDEQKALEYASEFGVDGFEAIYRSIADFGVSIK